MNQQIATTPEQSKRLIACRVDPKSADFVWMEDKPNNPRLTLRTEIIEDNNPYLVGYGWSLGRLLALLPPTITENSDYYDEICNYGLLIYPYMQGWQIDYQYCEDDECHCLKCIHGSDLIEACVKAIEWLTKEKFKLNEIKQ